MANSLQNSKRYKKKLNCCHCSCLWCWKQQLFMSMQQHCKIVHAVVLYKYRNLSSQSCSLKCYENLTTTHRQRFSILSHTKDGTLGGWKTFLFSRTILRALPNQGKHTFVFREAETRRERRYINQ